MRTLLRQRTRGLFIVTIIGVIVLVVVIALIQLIKSPNFGPQTAALVTASASLAGVLVTQVVNSNWQGELGLMPKTLWTNARRQRLCRNISRR
jgi:hypothetical protein